MSQTTSLREKLAIANLSMDRFRELVQRFLSYGVLVRDEDNTEQLLYDDAYRIESALVEYFEIAGLTLHHDSLNKFFRLYAPGAVVDGIPEDPLRVVPSLRARVSVDFVAAALALRFLYQDKLNQGLIDERGEAVVGFDDIAATLQTYMKRQLPEGTGERVALLADLKRHRLLRFSTNFSIADEDAYVAIRPTILGIVSNDALAAALASDGAMEPAPETETDPQDSDK